MARPRGGERENSPATRRRALERVEGEEGRRGAVSSGEAVGSVRLGGAGAALARAGKRVVGGRTAAQCPLLPSPRVAVDRPFGAVPVGREK